jgi:nitrate/nitrite transporter NarK
MNEKDADGNTLFMPDLTDKKQREVMFANINAYGSTGMAFRVC